MNSVHDSAKEWRVHPSQPLSQPEGGLQSNEQAHYSPVDQQQFAHPYQQQPSMSLQHPPPPSPHATSYHGKPDDEKAQGMAGSSQPSTPRPNPAADGSQQPTSSPTRGVESAAAAAAAAAAASYSGFHGNDYMMARKRGRSDSLFPPETGPFFSSTKSADNLYAMDRSTLLDVAIHAKMDRGFFLADNDWTCYRRNYFQVSACFSIHGVSHYFPDHELQTLVRGEDGALFPVRRFLIGISARVSNSEKRIELVQHTPKRDKGPQMVPQPKPIIPGGNLNLSTVSTNQSIATFERIQFKIATANNGKRRAAQQYYVCLVELYAETDHGQIKVAACQSAPLVVRGRSPGHYADHQERMGQMVTTSAPSQHSQHLSTPPQPPQPLSLPPPPPPSSHDDRFHSAFPRPPYTPPAIMPSEYGAAASYPPYYSPYTHFGGHPMHAPPMPHTMMMNNAPPTPTHHTPSTSTPGQAASPYPHAAAAPSHHHQHPYVISSMPPPDPNSPSSPTPHIYGSAAAAEYPNQQHHQQQHEDTKLALPPPPPHSSASPNGMSVPPPVPMESTVGGDWNGAGNRSRTNTAGGSPHYFAPHQGTPTLSSAASQTSAFSPTTPTTPYVGARKFNTVNNICNQQQAS